MVQGRFITEEQIERILTAAFTLHREQGSFTRSDIRKATNMQVNLGTIEKVLSQNQSKIKVALVRTLGKRKIIYYQWREENGSK